MAKSPLQTVRERFGGKDKLVEAVRALMTPELATDHVNSDKGLDHVSNRSLLRLHEILNKVKEEYGSRDKLVEAIAAAAGYPKDADRTARLGRYPTPRLLDLLRSARKRAQ